MTHPIGSVRRNRIATSVRTRDQIHLSQTMAPYMSGPTGPQISPEEHHARPVHCRGCGWSGTWGEVVSGPCAECPGCHEPTWVAAGEAP